MPHKPLPWKRAWAIALPAWAVSRVALFLVTWAGSLLLRPTHLQEGGAPGNTPVSLGSLFAQWGFWDGYTYLHIAANGYQTGRPLRAAFFPLYPLLIRIVEAIPGLGTAPGIAAGLLVGNAAALGAFLALALLGLSVSRFTLPVERSVWLLVAYPLAFFLAAIYTDALFLALACAVLLAAQRGAWRWMSLWLFLAALTRPTAVALLLPVIWEYARQCAWPVLGPAVLWGWAQAHTVMRTRHLPRLQRRHLRPLARTAGAVGLQALAPVGVVSGYIVGIGVFAFICLRQYGDALAFVHAQRRFDIVPSWPWQTIADVVQAWRTIPAGTWMQVRVLVDIVPVLVLLVATVAGARNRPIAFTLYMAGVLLLLLCSPIVGSLAPDPLAGGGRFVLAAVPLWLDLGAWSVRWPWLERALVPTGWAVQALLVVFVVTGGWLI